MRLLARDYQFQPVLRKHQIQIRRSHVRVPIQVAIRPCCASQS
jgi:hypothetical protein